VRHRETTFLTQSSILVGVDVAEDGVPADFKICPLTQIVALEPLGATE
jgi:hypothetical protein